MAETEKKREVKLEEQHFVKIVVEQPDNLK